MNVRPIDGTPDSPFLATFPPEEVEELRGVLGRETCLPRRTRISLILSAGGILIKTRPAGLQGKGVEVLLKRARNIVRVEDVKRKAKTSRAAS